MIIPSLRQGAACFAASLAAAIAIGSYFGPGMQGNAMLLAAFFLFFGAAILRPGKKDVLLAGLSGFAFSFFRVIGSSYDQLDSYGLIMKNAGTMLRALGAFIALGAVSACAVLLLFALFDRLRIACARTENADPRTRKRLFLFSAILIFLGSMPYLALYAPGLNIYDTRDQLLQFFGFSSYIGDGSVLSDHHPVFLTVVYGLFMKLGLAIGSPNAAQLLYSLLSTAVIALAFAYALQTLYDEGVAAKPLYIVAAFVALYPVFALYAFNMCKDVSAAPFVLILCAQLLKVHRTDGMALKSNRFALLVFLNALMLMLTRKPSLYALCFAALFLILAYKGVRVRMAACLLGAAFLFQAVYNGMVLPAFGVIPGETREMLSTPFQMTARVLHEGEEVTQEELSAISRVLNVDVCKERYNPRLSDPVKDSSNPNMTGEDLAAYLRAFVSVGLRHPTTYVEAFLNMIYGYFYPSDSNTIVCLTLNSPDQGGLFLTQDPALDDARLELHNTIYFVLRRLPGVSALFYVDTVTWLFLLLLVVFLRAEGLKAIAPHMFFVGTLGICILSPKSGEIRYLMPILYALPVMLGAALLPKTKELLHEK